MTRLLIIADDLSGAAETAGAVAEATGAAPALHLGRVDDTDAPVVAVDTGSRAMPPAGGAEATLQAMRRRHPDSLVYKKVDSLLRGNIRAEVAALTAAGHAMIAALAVPRVGRTVRDGVVHVDGMPVGSIPAVLAVRSAVVPLEVVRAGDLDRAIADVLATGAIPTVDAETDGDLLRVARSLARHPDPPVLLAAGGLARLLAPLLGIADATGRFQRGADRVVVVVGTREPSAARQVDALAIPHTVLRPGDEIVLGSGDAVVTLDAAAAWDEASLDAALRAVGRAIDAVGGRTDLVLTGGDTARRVLDARDIRRLQVEIEIEPGAVLSTTGSGAAVVTRPGSFGDDRGLKRLHAYLKGHSA